MPSKTKKQAKFMAAVANNPKFAKKAGVPQSVGQEFANADKRNKDMPSYFDSTKKKPGKAVKKGYKRGGRTAADTAGRRSTLTPHGRAVPSPTPVRAPTRGHAAGGKVHDEKVLRNLDDEVYRIAPKERMGGAEGRDARDERRRINREKDYEKRHMNKGGKVKKQGYNDRLDESLGARDGKKSQSLKSRRDESKGMEKAMGKGAYSGASTMMADGGDVQSAHDRRDESLGSTKPRGWGQARRGWQGRYDSTKRQR
jgi:hypothetical protein